VDDAREYWRKEKVTFQAAYGNERVIAYLFLPKNAAPPYQTILFFPGAGVLNVRSSERLDLDLLWFDFIVRSGRAVMYPVYKGTYERGPGRYYHRFGQPGLWREMNLHWSKDLGRSIDYLETRPEIDRGMLAYYGVSLGAAQGPRLMAVEDRFRTGVLMQGGFFERVPPEVDPLHFAPRVKIPTLMINGRDDFLFPLEGSQRPLFRLLGTPEKDKRHVLFNAGHDIFNPGVIRIILDWLDRYLGPVKTQ
jgi:pimeloyl-ACP methyl ester carboxylesterase